MSSRMSNRQNSVNNSVLDNKQTSILTSNVKNSEPFGWNIGLKAFGGGGSYAYNQKKMQNEKQLIDQNLQERIQNNLQTGIDNLIHNPYYRQVYEDFKNQ